MKNNSICNKKDNEVEFNMRCKWSCTPVVADHTEAPKSYTDELSTGIHREVEKDEVFMHLRQLISFSTYAHIVDVLHIGINYR